MCGGGFMWMVGEFQILLMNPPLQHFGQYRSIYFRSKICEFCGRICDDFRSESKEFGISWAREGWR
uniref:Uncharacterized protein n=1 Tax=uncultured Phormidium sp. TaxID=259949 RepID=W0FFS7_9CYAN|nr:hypothetical protein [uncultured Phormidium sp.]